MQLLAAYIERPHLSQVTDSALSLPVHSLSIMFPVQSAVEAYSQILVILHHPHFFQMDGNFVHVRPGPPKVNHHLPHVTSFSRRWLFLHQSTKWSTSPLNSVSLLPLTHPMTTESWENLCRLQDSEFFWKSEDYIVKSKVESTGPRGAPVLLTK